MMYQNNGIEAPHDHDVLSGRGHGINEHTGNKRFRVLVQELKGECLSSPKPEKPRFARTIVNSILNLDPPGRFLKKGNPKLDQDSKLWYEIGDQGAMKKTMQALREKN